LELKRLFAAAETLPGSSAECERGFSMNETVWDKCNRLQVDSIPVHTRHGKQSLHFQLSTSSVIQAKKHLDKFESVSGLHATAVR